MNKKWMAWLLGGLLLAGCGQDGAIQNTTEISEALFTEITDSEAQDVMQAMGSTEDQASSLKSRLVRVQFTVLEKAAAAVAVGETQAVAIKMKLNLFLDEIKTILISQIQKISENNIVFVGQIAGDTDSSVTLVRNQDAFVANLRHSDRQESYEVRVAAHGVHSINLKPDQPEDPCPAVAAPEDTAEDVATSEEPVDVAQATPIVRVLAAYTPGARSSAGGTSAIVALIQMGVADTNTALTNSGANMRISLAGTMELKTNEYGTSWSNNLGYLKGKTDGRWDDVHARRYSLKADQVSVVANFTYQSGTNGIGYVRASYSSAFSIVRRSSFGSYTFAHELGHNWGLNHSDGYVNYSGRFRTIMAYGTYPRIRRFSNPNISYSGYRTGTSYDYSVKIINSRASTMANLI